MNCFRHKVKVKVNSLRNQVSWPRNTSNSGVVYMKRNVPWKVLESESSGNIFSTELNITLVIYLLGWLLWLISRTMFRKVPTRITDLMHDSYSAGRGSTNDFCFSSDTLSDCQFAQLSKIHFKITKDIGDLTSPTYIEVSITHWILIFHKAFNQQSTVRPFRIIQWTELLLTWKKLNKNGSYAIMTS